MLKLVNKILFSGIDCGRKRTHLVRGNNSPSQGLLSQIRKTTHARYNYTIKKTKKNEDKYCCG